MDGRKIMLLIIGLSFLLLFATVAVTALLSSPLPTCTGRVSNQLTRTSRIEFVNSEGIPYTPGLEACHSTTRCNNPIVPCVYSPQTGTLCPTDTNYSNLLPEGSNFSCLSKLTCPQWSTIAFAEYNGFFVQTNENPSLCGVPASEVSRLWPTSCVRGQLTLNLDDNRYYCSNTSITCLAEEQLITEFDNEREETIFSCR